MTILRAQRQRGARSKHPGAHSASVVRDSIKDVTFDLMRVFSAFSLTAALALAGLFAAAQTASSQDLSGRRAPSFSLPDSKLDQHDILDYRGKWLLLDFMQTNCPHCKALSKTLEDLNTRYPGKLAVLSIVLPPENVNSVSKYIAENKVTVPILFDSSQVAASYFKATPTHSSVDMPHLFAVDPAGQIVRDWGQALVENPQLVKDIDTLVNGGTAAGKRAGSGKQK
jgi:peroxiredoxin